MMNNLVEIDSTLTYLQLETIPINLLFIILVLTIAAIIVSIFVPFVHYVLLSRRIEEALGKKRLEDIDKIEKSVNNLVVKVGKLETLAKSLNDKLYQIENRVSILERSRHQARATAIPAIIRPRAKIEEVVEPQKLSSLSELKVFFPDIIYAGFITSQGYIVESYGTPIEEPAKLLEILRLSEKFTGSREVKIVKGEKIISMFYVDNIGDLQVYGVLASSLFFNNKKFEVVKRTLTRYLKEKLKEK